MFYLDALTQHLRGRTEKSFINIVKENALYATKFSKPIQTSTKQCKGFYKLVVVQQVGLLTVQYIPPKTKTTRRREEGTVTNKHKQDAIHMTSYSTPCSTGYPTRHALSVYLDALPLANYPYTFVRCFQLATPFQTEKTFHVMFSSSNFLYFFLFIPCFQLVIRNAMYVVVFV